MQHCFSFPGPPYFGLSAQNLHSLQSSDLQPEHCPHLLRFFPKNINIYMYIYSNNKKIKKTKFRILYLMEKIYSPKNALFLTSPLGFGEPGSFQFLGGMPILSRLVKRN